MPQRAWRKLNPRRGNWKRRIVGFLDVLGEKRNGLIVIVGFSTLFAGGLEYHSRNVESSIDKALGVLERREQDNFLRASFTLYQKWWSSDYITDKLIRQRTIDKRLKYEMTKAIMKDEEYQSAIAEMAVYYTGAAACTLDDICDTPIMCGSLMGEINSYLRFNKGYFESVALMFGGAAKHLTYRLPEFLEYCKSDIHINLAARLDTSSECRWALWFTRYVGPNMWLSCEFGWSKYDRKIIDEAGELLADYRYWDSPFIESPAWLPAYGGSRISPIGEE